MRKFWELLKKEVRELLTWQMIIPLVAMIIIFMGIGKIMGSEVQKQSATSLNIVVIDYQKSLTSKILIDALTNSGYKVDVSKKSLEAQKGTMKLDKYDLLVVIPADLDLALNGNLKPNFQVYSLLDNVSILSAGKISKLESVYPIINETVSGIELAKATKGKNVAFLKSPTTAENFVLLNNKEAQIRPTEILGYVLSQTTFIPVVLFLVITMASQLVAVAMASEKENKTLETLLSLPIDRKTVVASKLLAGGIVSLVSSGLYLIGIQAYMKGITSVAGGGSGSVTDTVKVAVTQLGISMSTSGYVLLGVSLFASILVALSIAFILGTFAKDVKSVQGVITPLMMLLLIPYILSMLIDIRALPVVLKTLVYAIPFTHTFVAANNIMLGHLSDVYWGIGYLLIIVVVGIFLASKLFASEKIMTVSLDFGKKKRF